MGDNGLSLQRHAETIGAGGNTIPLVGDIGLSLQRHGETNGTGGYTTPLVVGNGGASDAWPIGEVATWGLRKPALRKRR